MKNIAVICMMAAALALAGCKKEQSSPPLTPKNLTTTGANISFTDEINSLKRAVEKNPRDLGALISLGNLLMDSDRNAEAIDAYSKALEIDPNNQNVRVDMGVCYRRTGQSDVAVKTIKKAIEMQPDHAMAHMNLGVILYDDFQLYPEAINEFETYLRLSPNAENAPAIRELVQNLKAQIAR